MILNSTLYNCRGIPEIVRKPLPAAATGIDKTVTNNKNRNFTIPPIEQKNIENIPSVSNLVITVQPPITLLQKAFNFIATWQINLFTNECH
jgi:hypothetical protein